MNDRDVREKVLSAARLRESLFGQFSLERETNAYRLINGEGDGLGGFLVDAYAGFLAVQVLGPPALPQAPCLEQALEEILHPRGIVRKLRYAERQRGRVPSKAVRGELPPARLAVLENGVRFEVELLRGLHTGLFTDMREERARMLRLARDKRVLNTFAYTGTFSVAAALGGAVEVTSVDVVRKVLERARRNFTVAGIDPARHHFACMEVLEYLRMAARKVWRFDIIVLDPPTFSSFKSGRWSLKTDYPELLRLSLAVLNPDGLLWISANTENLSPTYIERVIARVFVKAGRRARVLASGGLPPDHPTDVTRPEARYLKVCVVQAL